MKTAIPPPAALVTYHSSKSFEATLQMLRRSLSVHGLRVSHEVDVARRLRSDLGVGLFPCHTLMVDDPALLLEAIVFHRGAAEFFPQPVTVAASDGVTQIYLRGAEPSPSSGLPASIRGPLQQLHKRLLLVLDEVAAREDCPEAVPS